MTGAKLLGIVFLVIGAFFFARGGSFAHLFGSTAGGHAPGMAAFGAAMIAALQSGRLRHAALDVFHTEPLPSGHPLTVIVRQSLANISER